MDGCSIDKERKDNSGIDLSSTVDGSEIPDNHLGCIKPCLKMGSTTYLSLNCFFCAGVQNHQPVVYHSFMPNQSLRCKGDSFHHFEARESRVETKC